MVDNPRSTKRKAIIDEEDMVNTDNVLGSCKLNGVACDFREKNIFQQKKYVISITLVIEVSLEIQVHMLALEVKQCNRGYHHQVSVKETSVHLSRRMDCKWSILNKIWRDVKLLGLFKMKEPQM